MRWANLINFFLFHLYTITALFSSGELFHSRTISYYYKGAPKQGYAEGLVGYSDALIGSFIREGNSLKNSYELSDFISKNAVVLQISSDGSINEQKKSELLSGQKDLTHLLKIMFLLSTNIPRLKKVLAKKTPKAAIITSRPFSRSSQQRSPSQGLAELLEEK